MPPASEFRHAKNPTASRFILKTFVIPRFRQKNALNLGILRTTRSTKKLAISSVRPRAFAARNVRRPASFTGATLCSAPNDARSGYWFSRAGIRSLHLETHSRALQGAASLSAFSNGGPQFNTTRRHGALVEPVGERIAIDVQATFQKAVMDRSTVLGQFAQ